MKVPTRLPAVVLLLTTPLAAYAEPIPHIEALYAFGGGLLGGLVGALLACWLCRRIQGPKDSTDSKKY